MNPAISVNGLFLGTTSRDNPTPEANGIFLQEAEVQFSSVVDPFWTAELIVAWEQPDNHSPYETHIEVASLRSTSMPAGMGLTLGKFFLPFGKHAILHPHQWAFIDAPLAVAEFLGDHGMCDIGMSVDMLLPTPWYSELVVYVTDGRLHIFDEDNRDLSYGTRLTNTWDLSMDGTLELGGSLINGPVHEIAKNGQKKIFGADLTYKWSSGSISQGPAVNWTNEIILPEADSNATGNPYGIYSHFQYRFDRNWWLGVAGGITREKSIYDAFGSESLCSWNESKVNVTFVPSEFSAIRAEIALQEREDLSEKDLKFSIQWNFTIGSHPAHLY
ncbi:MAG: hypothetical protein GY893_00455 [bacterium]|nr:hypothetical protein [bacterium]